MMQVSAKVIQLQQLVNPFPDILAERVAVLHGSRMLGVLT